MNAPQQSRATPLYRFHCGDIDPSSRWNGQRKCRRRRNHRSILLFATALFYNSNVNRSNGCDAFVTYDSRTICSNRKIEEHYREQQQSPFTKWKLTTRTRIIARTRTRHSGNVFTTKRHQSSPDSNTYDNTGGENLNDNTGNNSIHASNAEATDGANRGQHKPNSGNRDSSVYDDLETLERAVTLENADLKLRHSNLKERIDFIDQSKRLVVPDALRFLVVPLVYAYGLFRLLPLGNKEEGILQLFGRSITKAMDLHFWVVVVGAPLLLNACKIILRMVRFPRRDPIPDQLKNLDPICATLLLSPDLYDYEDPRASCDDVVSFLVEYWTSAVNGIAFLYAGKAIVTNFGFRPFQSSGAMLWLSCTQLLTRLAAVVSLYQYPEKLYELERSDLTRPVGVFPVLMLKLIRWMMILAPFGLISDFSKVLLHLPEGSIYPLYASIAVFLFGTWTRMRESISSKVKKDPLGPARLKSPKPLAKVFYGLSTLALWRKHLPALGLSNTVEICGNKMFQSFPIMFWKAVGLVSIVSLSLLGPLIHLKAFSKIFQVEYTNDLPSLSTKESYQKAIKERPERAYDMAWRHSVRWRKPQRLKVSKGWIYHDIIYWYLFKGSVMERINNDRTDQIRKRVCSGRTIQDRIQRELEARPKGTLLNGDRDDWKSKAMDFQAQKHESSYNTGQFEDPLGVAIYKAFGIGLGYNFDHMSQLEEGEEPSSRRLQARAAKSALRRYNELNDAEQALISKIKQSEDPKEKKQFQKSLETSKTVFDEEIKHLAGKLQKLVPTTSKPEEFGLMDAAKFKMNSEPKNRKVSPDEYRKLEEDPLGFDEPSIRNEIV